MAKWGTIFIGFILTVIVKAFFGYYEFLGLIFVGFLVGVMAHSGILGGLWNAALAGAFGNIVCAIIFIILVATGSTLLAGPFGGLIGFTISGLTSLIDVIANIIYYMVVMGVAGAVGGAIAKKRG